MQTPRNGELLTVPEVAAMLRLSERKVRRLINDGELKGVQLGERTIRVRPSDLDTFLIEREVPKSAGDHTAHQS